MTEWLDWKRRPLEVGDRVKLTGDTGAYTGVAIDLVHSIGVVRGFGRTRVQVDVDRGGVPRTVAVGPRGLTKLDPEPAAPAADEPLVTHYPDDGHPQCADTWKLAPTRGIAEPGPDPAEDKTYRVLTYCGISQAFDVEAASVEDALEKWFDAPGAMPGLPHSVGFDLSGDWEAVEVVEIGPHGTERVVWEAAEVEREERAAAEVEKLRELHADMDRLLALIDVMSTGTRGEARSLARKAQRWFADRANGTD